MGMPIIVHSTTAREQSITDIIQSVALEQTALSHILNAEGEKIQKVIAVSNNVQQMLEVNASVEKMVNSVIKLEMLLQSKLGMFSGCLCLDQHPCEPIAVTVTNTSGNAVEIEPNVYSISVAPGQSTFINTVPTVNVTASSLESGFTLVGNALIAPPTLIPFQLYTNVIKINEQDQQSPCEFEITIKMVYANA